MLRTGGERGRFQAYVAASALGTLMDAVTEAATNPDNSLLFQLFGTMITPRSRFLSCTGKMPRVITYILHIAAGTDQCRCEIMLCGIFIAGTGGEGPSKAAGTAFRRWKNTEAHDVRPEDRG